MRSALESGWRFIDKKRNLSIFSFTGKSREGDPGISGDGATRFRIFERVLTSALLIDRLAGISPETWQYQCGKFLKVSLRCNYKSFVIHCHVQGKYVKPNTTRKCQRPLATAVNEARKVFQDQFPTFQIPNTKCILKLFTYLLFDFE